MIKLNGVSKTYQNGHQALKNLSFELESGEMAFVLGHSGAGKSKRAQLTGRTNGNKGTDGPCHGSAKSGQISHQHCLSLYRLRLPERVPVPGHWW